MYHVIFSMDNIKSNNFFQIMFSHDNKYTYDYSINFLLGEKAIEVTRHTSTGAWNSIFKIHADS